MLDIKTGIKLLRPCVVCGTDHGIQLGQLDFAIYDSFSIGKNTRVVCCCECGAVFYETHSTQKDYLAYYEAYEFNHTCSSPGTGSCLEQDTARFETIFKLISPLNMPPDAAIADIGCARGGLLKTLFNHGYTNLTGIDPLAANLTFPKEYAPISTVTGNASKIPFEDSRFDLICLTHTLEHLFSPKTSLSEIYRALKPGGHLFIEVPNASAYPGFPQAPLWNFLYEHINHFDAAALINLTRACGFSAKSVHTSDLVQNQNKDESLYGVFKKEPVQNGQLTPDFSLAKKLEGLFKPPDTITCFLNEYSNTKKTLHAWGLSSYMLYLLETYLYPNFSSIKLYDKDPYKQTLTIHSQKISDPENLKRLSPRTDIVVITTTPYIDKMKNYFGLLNTGLPLSIL